MLGLIQTDNLDSIEGIVHLDNNSVNFRPIFLTLYACIVPFAPKLFVFLLEDFNVCHGK